MSSIDNPAVDAVLAPDRSSGAHRHDFQVALPPDSFGDFLKMPRSDQSRWFAEEVQPHEPVLRAYLRKQFPSLSDVDDVVQESHLRLLQAREKGRIESAKSYLFAIARNIVLGVFRKKRPGVEVEISEIAEVILIEEGADGAEHASIRQEFMLATEAIDRLPTRCREIVVLRALRGLSHREIALELGLSEQTVRVQVARGMKKCAQYLREHGVDRRPSHARV